MTKRVVKIGGSVLKKPDNIKRIIQVVKSYSPNPVIVVSALYGITSKLESFISKKYFNKEEVFTLITLLRKSHFKFIEGNIDNIHYSKIIKNKLNYLLKELENYLTGLHLIGDIPDFSRFFVLSFGERLSSILISSILTFYGIRNRRETPEDIGLYADSCSSNASVDFERSELKVRKNLSGDSVFIIPGFYGKTVNSRVALFGKGGSDYTAAAIAGCIGAISCDLWKDVDGFMTADPEMVKNTKKISELSYEEASELSYFGAGIVHPETFEPLKQLNIPLRIYNILIPFGNNLPEASTSISTKKKVKKDIVKSITFSNDFAVLRVKGSGVGIHPGIISSISENFSRAGINIKSIITTQTSINFLLSLSDIDLSYSLVNSLNLPEAEKIETEKDISLIAAVGTGFRERYGIIAKILSTLSHKKINIRLITAGASDEAIYFIIKKDQCSITVRELHRKFFG